MFVFSLAACLSPCFAGGPSAAQERSPVLNDASRGAPVATISGEDSLESGVFRADPAKRYVVSGAFDVPNVAGDGAEVSLVLKSSAGEEDVAMFDVSSGGAFPVKEALPCGLAGECSISLAGAGIVNADLAVNEIGVEVAGDSGGESGKAGDSSLLGYVSWFNYCNGILGNSGYALNADGAASSGLNTSLKALAAVLDALYVDAAKGSDLASGAKDAPKATISAAFTAAQSGQVIILESGTHVWGGSASGKSVTIRPNGSVTVRGAR